MKVLVLLVIAIIAFTRVNAEENLTGPAQNVLDVVGGILETAFGSDGAAAVACIKQGEAIFASFEKSIPEFKAGGFHNVVNGLVHIGSALKEIPNEFKTCEKGLKVVKDIEKIIGDFLNPEELAVDIGKAIIWHGFHIFHDITSCVHNFEAKNYNAAGRNIGDIIYTVFHHKFRSTLNGPAQESIDTVEGLLIGAFGDKGKGASVCLQDGEVVFTDIENAIKDFEQGGVTNIVAGLYNIGLALEQLPEEFKNCEAAELLLPEIEKVAAEFKDPKELAIHIGSEVLWHGTDIYGDIKGATADFNDGNYEPAGEMIGDIIKVLLVQSVKDLIKVSA